MKVGVLTFHYGANFGGFLQAYCMRQEISQAGHDCEIINYKNSHHATKERLTPRLTPRLDFYFKALKKKSAWKGAFGELVEGEPATNVGEIQWADYDAIVVGSDVVWDYETEKFGSDSAYFGVVPGKDQVRWVSYAASCGRAGESELDKDKKEGLRGFSALGVRDVATQKMVRSATDRESQIVVDPTWLADQEKKGDSEGTKAILAIYGYAKVSPEFVSAIRNFAKTHGLKVVSYGFNHQWADENRLVMTPFEWIEALREARCVVTGTFHGSLYSIRLRKAFCTINNPWISNKIRAPFDLIGNDECLVETPEALTAQLTRQTEEGATQFLRSSGRNPQRVATIFEKVAFVKQKAACSFSHLRDLEAVRFNLNKEK